jgi:zinc transporter ZupT
LQALAAVAAAIVGIAFAHVVAANDLRMQILFSATVGMGLFLVFSGLATELKRKRRN